MWVSGSKACSQQLPGAMQLSLAGSDCDTELSRGVLVRVTVERYEHKDVAGTLGQCGNGAFDVEGRRLFDAAGQRLERRRVVQRRFAAGGESPSSREHRVDGNAMQPAGEAAAVFEGRQRTPSGDKGFLNAILGRGGMP